MPPLGIKAVSADSVGRRWFFPIKSTQYRMSDRFSMETSFNDADFERTNKQIPVPSRYHSSCRARRGRVGLLYARPSAMYPRARFPMVPFPLVYSRGRFRRSQPSSASALSFYLASLYLSLSLLSSTPSFTPSIVSIIDGEGAHVENGWSLERIVSPRQWRVTFTLRSYLHARYSRAEMHAVTRQLKTKPSAALLRSFP